MIATDGGHAEPVPEARRNRFLGITSVALRAPYVIPKKKRQKQSAMYLNPVED